MERIIVDMDEVIADTMGGMIEWYTQTYGLPIDYQRMLGQSWLNGFPEQHRQLVWNRLLSPGFFRHIPVIEKSQDVLKAINERYELYIVSAAMEFPNSLQDKQQWLGEHFPFIHWKQIVLCGDKRLISGDHMVDDHARNLVHFNGNKYLFTAAHNLNEQEYQRFNNWEEIAAVFLK